jgi:N utilization substance protein B
VLAASKTLLQGLLEKRQELDKLIQTYAPAWPVHLLAPIDRNILRIALYELLYHTETPAKTAINEAVELAKVFGSESSARFVNGVLGTVMTALSRGELNQEELASEGR